MFLNWIIDGENVLTIRVRTYGIDIMIQKLKQRKKLLEYLAEEVARDNDT